VSAFESKIEKTTSQTKAATFHNTSSNAGISVAETISTTKVKGVADRSRSVHLYCVSAQASSVTLKSSLSRPYPQPDISNISKFKALSPPASSELMISSYSWSSVYLDEPGRILALGLDPNLRFGCTACPEFQKGFLGP